MYTHIFSPSRVGAVIPSAAVKIDEGSLVLYIARWWLTLLSPGCCGWMFSVFTLSFISSLSIFYIDCSDKLKENGSDITWQRSLTSSETLLQSGGPIKNQPSSSYVISTIFCKHAGLPAVQCLRWPADRHYPHRQGVERHQRLRQKYIVQTRHGSLRRWMANCVSSVHQVSACSAPRTFPCPKICP